MDKLLKALRSTVGHKFLVGLSGLGVVGFMVTHLAANTLLYLPDPGPFNAYVQGLKDWGHLLTAAELGLGGLFVFHIVTALMAANRNRTARPAKYHSSTPSKGGIDKSNLSSRTMKWTGIILLGFLIAHILHFRFGPGIEAGYVTEINGKEARDLHRYVVEAFQNPLVAGLYAFVMIFLGIHVRHGFWSAFQSLGLSFPKYSQAIYILGILVALTFALGFLGIPIWIYFNLGGALS